MKSATIRDVARAAEVSVATVSRTLNGIDNVAGPTRDRILEIASRLDYVPNSGARALSTRRTDTIGVLLPDLHGEFFSELIRGIDLAARARGLHLLLSSSHGDASEAAAALRAMRSRVDSIIVMMSNASQSFPEAASVPMVVLGGPPEQPARNSLAIDNYAGALAITRHLAETGRRTIAFVTGPASNYDAAERLRGYRAATEQAGMPERIIDGDFSEQAGRAAADYCLRAGLPDAIFCANDMMAIGCLDALRRGGVPVPLQVAVAGFDDIPIARYVSPSLTTAAVPIAEIGRQALECCARAIGGAAGADQTIFKPELVIRESTAAPTLTHGT